ncbi:GDSL esterase/lipase CPRD49 isoform X2 [Cajanus cajan]|uniref:GDSL esterase/lipase CPRD49 isoform X2 n=1 Tax=Cajanus cajan TaxID=3821 RepID=UPI0010FBAF33|nr:GDSL esterase/lipase CPRD49 isoform X2 [Cajanus cajan]
MSGALVRPEFVVFGSSIVQYGFHNEGWIAALSHFYARKADIILRGYAAWNTRRALQVLDKIFPKDVLLQPSLVIVYFGGNDSSNPHSSGLGPHVPLQEYVENLRIIVNHLKSLSANTRILLLTAPPINDATIILNSDGNPSRTNEACGIYSNACLEVCREMNIKAIDLWSAIQKRDNWQDVCFIKIVLKEILKVLKEAEWEPSLHWKSMKTEFEEDSPYDPPASDGKSTINLSHFSFFDDNNLD